MRNYNSPQVTYLGDLAALTGITGDPVEQDTFVTAEGDTGNLSGPASQIFCEDSNNNDLCDNGGS